MKISLQELRETAHWIFRTHAPNYALKFQEISRKNRHGKTRVFLEILQNPCLHIRPCGMRNPHLDVPISDKDGYCDLEHFRPKTQAEIDDSWSTISIASWSPSGDLAQIIPAERKKECEFLNFISRWLEARKKSKKRFSKMRDAYIEFIEVVEGTVEEAKLKMAVKGNV